MKVTLINTSDAGGGAPAACMRLLKALGQQQVDAGMAVQHKKTTNNHVWELVSKRLRQLNFLRERLPFIFFYARDKSVRFAFSTANTGTNISDKPVIANADVLHLHWTNSGFQSIKNLTALLASGKPVVWTLHDMWAFTGGCHYAGDCNHFLHECGNCWMLRQPSPADLSHTGWLRKQHMLNAAANLTIVTCSNWLGDVARKSSLLKGFNIITIPNPIDTAIFSPRDKTAARAARGIGRDKKIILFGAANINDRRKGISYLVEALHQLKSNYTGNDEIEVVIFGKNKHFDVTTLPFKVHELNVITSEVELAEVYNMADVFISPAIEDNLPNMVMEALACGTPVVAFNTGGIPDMVDHLQNGYLAEYKSAVDLASGLRHVLFAGDAAALSAAARTKVMANFTNEIVANQYADLYRSISK